MYCVTHKRYYHSLCVDCAALANNSVQNTGAISGTTYGAGRSESYYPPGAGVGIKDMVNSPSHYTQGGIETIDYIKAKLTPEEFKGYLKGNIIKYTSRAGLKDEVAQEFSKAKWYIQRMIDELDPS